MTTAILTIDQGTTSTRAILFSPQGEILRLSQKELKLHYPQNGWVEQDPEDIWRDTVAVCHDITTNAPVDIAAIGITNQRETTILWDRRSGKPVYNAIVWQDRRTADFCARLKAQGHEPAITQKTGLLLDPYFSATKIAWILDNVDGAREAALRGDLAFGTIDTFVLWRLTGGKVHATDAANAARTMLFDIAAQRWDDDLLGLFNVPPSLLPNVIDNAGVLGTTDATLFGRALPVCGMAGDQQAALFGQACFAEGEAKATYGTGCFALVNTGTRRTASQNRLLTTIAWRLNGKTTYALEGSIFVAGAAVQWLRDGLGLIAAAADSDAMAQSVPHTNGVYFVPALTGLGAPYWEPDARGTITGITRDTTRAHLVRAALEAQAYQTADLAGAMAGDSAPLHALRIDGGLSVNTFMCQFLADILGKPVEVPPLREVTAWGAACLAALGAGIFTGLDDVRARRMAGHIYEPRMDEDSRARLYEGWKTSIAQTLASCRA